MARVLLLLASLATCIANFTNPFKNLTEGGKFEVTWDKLPDDSLPAYIAGRVFNSTEDGVTSFQANVSCECCLFGHPMPTTSPRQKRSEGLASSPNVYHITESRNACEGLRDQGRSVANQHQQQTCQNPPSPGPTFLIPCPTSPRPITRLSLYHSGRKVNLPTPPTRPTRQTPSSPISSLFPRHPGVHHLLPTE